MSTELLIACALEKELDILRDRLEVECQFLATGLGTERTRRTLERRFKCERPSLFLFTGTAGQLATSLQLGQVVFPVEWCFQSGSCFAADPQLTDVLRKQGWQISGRGLTVSFPVLRAKTRLSLHQGSGALVCDMESAVALQAASRYRIPSLAPKVISDTAHHPISTYWTEFENNMERLAKYLERLLECL